MKGLHQIGILVMMMGQTAFAFPPSTIGQTPARKPPTSWLDRALSNWNDFGNPLPQAPNIRGAQANINRCQAQIRQPTTPEDLAIARFGWSLVGPIQIYDRTSVIIAASDFDGMCRPLSYQGFVFVYRKFSGTLSPQLMDSRTDGSFQQVYFVDGGRFVVEFDRYKEKDPLCCPSQLSLVTYQISVDEDLFLVVPVEVQIETTEGSKS